MILVSASGVHFEELGTKIAFRSQTITFLKGFLKGIFTRFFCEIWGSLERCKVAKNIEKKKRNEVKKWVIKNKN